MSTQLEAPPARFIQSPDIDGHRRRGLLFLGLACAAVGFAMTSQLALNSNFTAQTMNLSGLQQGVLETFRESCGITAFGILALLAGLAEPLIASAMLVLLGVGLASYCVVPNYAWLIVASLVWSQGLHVWMPLPNSMTMSLAEPERVGHRLGQVAAAGAAGSGLGLAVAYILNWAGLTIRPLWLVAGAAALLGAVACLGIPRNIKTPGPRFVIRRKYSLYYLMCFLEGWRKQIFIAFAGFLLVKKYDTPLSTMLLLWMATQVLNWLTSPIVGRLIDRVGQRPVLVTYFASLTLVFVGYATLQSRYVLYALFVLDGAFFVLSMALTTYVNRIAPTSEHTPTLSLGVAANHVAAVAMPLVGGLIWKYAGYNWTFWIGAAAAAGSILAAMRIPPAGHRGSSLHQSGLENPSLP